MFPLKVFSRFRSRVVFSSFRYVHVTAAGHVAPGSVSCLAGVSQRQLHATGRSFLNLNKLASTRCPSTRCLSSATPSEEGNLIYNGTLSRALRGVKTFSYSTSGISLLILPKVIQSAEVFTQSLFVQAFTTGVGFFFILLTPTLLHILSKGYVVRLYHNPESDTYTAVTYGVFLTEKKRTFHLSQVRVPDLPGAFTSFYANDKALLVSPESFTDPQDYDHLMGYDKEFSFSPEDMDQPDKS